MNRDIFCSCINLNQIHIQEKCGTSVEKELLYVYSPHLNWHSTLAVVPSIFYCDTLHPRFYQIPESQSWSRLYCDSHIGVKSFMKSKLKIWCFITCTIRIVPGCWAWSQLLGPGTILMMLHIHGTFMIFFSQSFCDTIFIRLKNLMRFLKGFGQVVRFLAGIQTGYKFVRITGFHTKSCKTHSFRFQLLDMRRTSCSIL